MSVNRKDFIGYPTNRVVGTVANAGKAQEAIDALLKAGFNAEDIDILHGEEDLHRLDPTGAGHGFLAQFHRTMIRSLDLEEFKHLTHHVEDVRAGRYVIMVLTRRRGQRIVASDILHHSGAEFVGFYGRWAWADLPASGHNSPADIPVLFTEAWNARDPDALAALFDEDAEFVNGAGLRFHDRASIRKAYTDRLARGPDTSVLVADEIKVRLLTAEVAVVHARMTLSGERSRTTVASFVVHRAGQRWLCASAHNTDVVPEAAPARQAAAG
jgi:uncharacterized protein (TIGR02246 family)